MNDQNKVLKPLKMGTTEMLVLAMLTQGKRYGYEISREVFERSRGFFDFKQGFLYPALRRMEQEKLIAGQWKNSSSGGPNRKYFRITWKGRSRLHLSIDAWSEFHRRFDRMLSIAKAPSAGRSRRTQSKS